MGSSATKTPEFRIEEKVTTHDIARYLGVARPTVSTVLSGAQSNTRVSAKLRARILKAADELGYRPNAAASAVRRGRFGAIGVLQAADSARGGLPRNSLYGLQVQAFEHDMHLSMGIAPDADLTDPAGLPKVLREWCVDGLLVSYTAAVPPLMVEHIARHRIPAVWMNVRREHDCVHPDDFGGVLSATEVLLELGHRRIAYAGPRPSADPACHYSTTDRFEGYSVALRRAGLTPNPCFRKRTSPHQTPSRGVSIQPLIDLLKRPERPTAIISADDVTNVLFAAHLAGLSVPEDLSVLAITEGISEVMGVVPAQMRIHTYGMGWRAFAQLQQKMARPDQPLDPVAVYCTFDRGQTLAPPLRGGQP